jgi:hypothetical protein
MQKGAGGAKLYAAIGVTYPKGAVLTCSNADGAKTFTAETTAGEWVFAIPENGKWTIACGNKTAEVNITEEGQFEEVTISFELVLFGEGSAFSWTGASGNGSGSYSVTSDALKVNRASGNGNKIMWAYVYTATAIDISKFNKLCFDISQISGSKIGIAVATGAGAGEKSQYAAYKEISSTGVVELDVSTLSGNYYIYLTAYREFTSSATSCTATRAWLE